VNSWLLGIVRRHAAQPAVGWNERMRRWD
jgi:hypothetical protein